MVRIMIDAAELEQSELRRRDLEEKNERLEREVQRLEEALTQSRAGHDAAQEVYENEIAILHGALRESKEHVRERDDALHRLAELHRRRLEDIPGRLPTLGFRSIQEAKGWRLAYTKELRNQREIEAEILRQGADQIDGHCFVCGGPSRFRVRRSTPDQVVWRETLQCVGCHLQNRQRAMLHLLDTLICPSPESRIYITEQVTVLYKKLCQVYDDVTGSEFLRDGTAPGELNADGIRHEDLTALTFDDEHIDLIACFEVLEHVPDYRGALRECLRILRPGGELLITVPFDPNLNEHLVRAVVKEDGEIEHLMEPEYHGDPLREDGCLAFYLFGWKLLDELREIGFRDVESHHYWSRKNAHLGVRQNLIVARKDGPRTNINSPAKKGHHDRLANESDNIRNTRNQRLRTFLLKLLRLE